MSINSYCTSDFNGQSQSRLGAFQFEQITIAKRCDLPQNTGLVGNNTISTRRRYTETRSTSHGLWFMWIDVRILSQQLAKTKIFCAVVLSLKPKRWQVVSLKTHLVSKTSQSWVATAENLRSKEKEGVVGVLSSLGCFCCFKSLIH